MTTKERKNKIIIGYMVDHPEEFPLDEELLKEIKNFGMSEDNIRRSIFDLINDKNE
jgi:hypothetical protein